MNMLCCAGIAISDHRSAAGHVRGCAAGVAGRRVSVLRGWPVRQRDRPQRRAVQLASSLQGACSCGGCAGCKTSCHPSTWVAGASAAALSDANVQPPRSPGYSVARPEPAARAPPRSSGALRLWGTARLAIWSLGRRHICRLNWPGSVSGAIASGRRDVHLSSEFLPGLKHLTVALGRTARVTWGLSASGSS